MMFANSISAKLNINKEIIVLDCLFIGSATQDVLLLIDEPPQSNRRLLARDISYVSGGIAATAASAFQTLGGSAGLVTAKGEESEITSFIVKDLEGQNFPYLQMVAVKGGMSSFSAIQVERNGSRCITHYGGCIQQINVSSIDTSMFSETKLIHLGGLSDTAVVECAQFYKENYQGIVSVDGGNYSISVLESLLPYVDIMILDDTTVKKEFALPNKAVCKYFSDKGVTVSCVTMGPHGALAYFHDEYYSAPAFPVSVLDTTGAGDNFHGAFLYCYAVRHYDMETTLRFCNTFSAITCTGLGGRSRQLCFEEIWKAIEKGEYDAK